MKALRLCALLLAIDASAAFAGRGAFAVRPRHFARLGSVQRSMQRARRTSLHLRPPRGSKYVLEGPGEPDYLDPYTSIPEFEFYREGLGEHGNETLLFLGGGYNAVGRDYRPVKDYMGTLVPSERLPDEEGHWSTLPKRLLHPHPYIREEPFHTRRPVPFPIHPPFQVFLAMINRTCQEDFEREDAQKPPDAMIIARPPSGVYSTWDAVMLAREFGGDANDPSIQKHLEWGMPQPSFADCLPYRTRFAATMTREELLDAGEMVEEGERMEEEELLERIRNTYPEEPKQEKSPERIAYEQRIANDPEYHAQQARAAAKRKEAHEKAAKKPVTSPFSWEPVHIPSEEVPLTPPELVPAREEIPESQFRARSLYEYTDWGNLHYQAEKRLFGDKPLDFDDLLLREQEFDRNELIKFLQDIPIRQ